MITLIILTLWYNGILIFNYPDKKEDKIKGIDVSAYQGDIDWNILSKQGIDFVLIKYLLLFNIDIKKTQKQLQIMLEKLEEYYEKKPIIYATYKSYNLYIANNFEGNFIWIRDVYFRPNLIDNRDWTFWQYSNKVRLNGYSGQEKRIDMNVFNGDKEKFEKMFN